LPAHQPDAHKLEPHVLDHGGDDLGHAAVDGGFGDQVVGHISRLAHKKTGARPVGVPVERWVRTPRAAVEAHIPMEIMEVNLEGPKAGEVLVEIKATGICHTDEFTLSGATPRARSPRSSAMRARASCSRWAPA
jgi:hypothetical protein